jgi:hypothetical protein
MGRSGWTDMGRIPQVAISDLAVPFLITPEQSRKGFDFQFDDHESALDLVQFVHGISFFIGHFGVIGLLAAVYALDRNRRLLSGVSREVHTV